MAPVEMMACGRPVVALAAGGALETVVDGMSGVFAEQQTIDAFVGAILRLESMRFDPGAIRAHAETFSQERFAGTMRALVAARYEELQRRRARRTVRLTNVLLTAGVR
jgi:glycosyltransferase involved in cell wall biosynthesis